MYKKYLLLLGSVSITSYNVWAGGDLTKTGILGDQQDSYNVIQTPVPFLNIAPDSRAGAMGDMGAATTPDLNSLHWNAAKYAFCEDAYGISTTYSPWLKKLAADIKLLYLTGFVRIDKRQVVAMGLRYFTLGTINFTDENNTPISTQNPNEFTIDAAYSMMFSEKMSGGFTVRYIRSDLSKGSSINGEATKAGTSYAADISTYYHTPIHFGTQEGEWAWGINISNMGSKISYTEGDIKDFIPANLRIGTAITASLDAYNKIMIGFDINKLLVPSPPKYKTDSLGELVLDANDKKIILEGMDPDVAIAQGMLQSFYDAPGGLSEELKEIMFSVGAEYWYQNQFALRVGYFNESAMKGNRKYATVGVGLRLTVATLDFSYLIPSGGNNNPLANTMRITASFDIGKPKKTK
jgi:hypothetical protein